MKFFLKKTALFLLPIFLWLSIIILVDPFNFFNISRFIDDEIKMATLSRSHLRSNEWALWKLMEYERSDIENIIIGDSRVAALKTKEINKIANMDYYNYGIPGLDIQSICDIFWHINSKHNIKNLYIAVSFHYFREDYNAQIFKNIVKYEANIFKYVKSKWVIECLIDNLKRKFFTEKYSINNTNVIKKEWETSVNNQFDVYKSYQLNESHFHEFEKIINFCNLNDINLNFIIFPEYSSVFQAIESNNLLSTYEEFISFFNSKGNLYNFNEGNITNDIENFNDPYHPKEEINRLIIESIW